MSSTTDLFERPKVGSRAVLVHIVLEDSSHGRAVVEFPPDDAPDDSGADSGSALAASSPRASSFAEFRELVLSAGAEPVATISGRRRSPDRRFFVGSGKVEEIRAEVLATGADLIIFDHRLSPGQERNLERALECRVLDRIGLILDIFAQRASTFEGKLQVELAQLRHLSSRLVRGWSHLERQKGGIGLRGPGETQLETDRRLIGTRIKQIDRRLEGVRRRRGLSRRARDKHDVPVVSLVGYTNAGKSTVFNRLTGAQVFAEDRLFATLDPTLRRVNGPGDPGYVLADTVGFIADLPHELVAAFRATLEETERASLLLHVVDASAPGRRERMAEVEKVLGSIATEQVPRLEVFNKIDACEVEPHIERDVNGEIFRVWLSARTGAGFDLLAEAIAERLHRERHHFAVTFSAADGWLRAQLYEHGEVTAERYDDSGAVTLELRVAPRVLERTLEQALEAGRPGHRRGNEDAAMVQVEQLTHPGSHEPVAESVEVRPAP